MRSVLLFKMRPLRMKAASLAAIAEFLGIKGKPTVTEEAIALHDSSQTLVYAQPGAKFGGLLLYVDSSKAMAEPVEKVLGVQRARRWADSFRKKFDLAPGEVEDARINLSSEISCHENIGVFFDGKERRKKKVKTEISSRICLDDILAVGPRAKVRMVFKDREKPVLIHRGVWDTLEVFEERELVRENDVVGAVRRKLDGRAKDGVRYDIVDVKLAYFAREFHGGPDILAPFYFIEVEFEDKSSEKVDITEGPRQVFWVPAYR